MYILLLLQGLFNSQLLMVFVSIKFYGKLPEKIHVLKIVLMSMDNIVCLLLRC